MTSRNSRRVPTIVESVSDADTFISNLGLSVRASNILTQLGVESQAQLVALNSQTLLLSRNCGKKTAAEIMAVVERFSLQVEGQVTTNYTDPASLGAALERIRVGDIRLSARAISALEKLNITTIGQLAHVSDRDLLGLQNFGRISLRELHSKLALLRSRLVVWPVSNRTSHNLNPRITRAALKLRRLKNMSGVSKSDPRFGHIVREIGLGAYNVREAATLIVRRKIDPLNPEVLIQRIDELLSVSKSAGCMFIEAELWNLTDGVGGNERDRIIIAKHLGWDGKPARTLEAVGQEFGMTRERVRQICTRMEAVIMARPFVPVIDRALKMVAQTLPASVKEIDEMLIARGLTKSGFSVEALVNVAKQFGRNLGFSIEVLHSNQVIVPVENRDQVARISKVARGAVSHWGVATIEDIAGAAGATPSLTRKIVPFIPGFQWLDEPSGWFWIANTSRNSLLTQIRKIMTASPIIAVGELRTGVGRHHLKKGFAPPRRVLLEFCRQQSWCRVEGERIMTAAPLIPAKILSNSEQIILNVLREHGPVIRREKFENLCIDAGMNPRSFWFFLSYCPLICRHASGVYGLRGAEVPVGLVEQLAPIRTRKSKLLVDYGWTPDRNIQVLYQISNSTLSNGIICMPAALKSFAQGKFALLTSDNFKIGNLIVKEGSAWGLGPFFHRRGGEAGDYLLLVFNLSKREVVAQLGDSSLCDQLDTTTDTKVTDECEPTDALALG